ncbi:hypothetical protein, partial [Rhizobium laguerreae]
SVKRLRFILWSSQMGQSLLQNGLFQRGKVRWSPYAAALSIAVVIEADCDTTCPHPYKTPSV